MRWPDAGLRATAAELRDEWRAEEEAWTRAALEHFEHTRTLVDVLRAAMHRGDEVLLGAASTGLRASSSTSATTGAGCRPLREAVTFP